jgi:cell division protease FtsH
MQFPPNKKDKEQPPQKGGSGNNPNPKDNNDRPRIDIPQWAWIALWLVFLSWVFFQLSGNTGITGSGQVLDVAYSDLRDEVRRGNVDEVSIGDETVQGRFQESITYPEEGDNRATSDAFRTIIPPDAHSELITLLDEFNVNFEAERTSLPIALVILGQWAPLILIIAFIIWMTRRASNQASSGIFGFGQSNAREYKTDFPQVTFEDVAGQDAAKTELEEVVDFLKEPDKYIALGAQIPRGVLLVGPPGTGKTLMARAVAGEANVAFFSLSASEFVEMFVGVGASRVRDLFGKAKKAAPAIIFIDEIDAVGRQRGAGLGGGNDEREQTLNQMLAEMDGFDRTESVIVMAATNRPDVLDPALLRPGRFDRQVTVGPPDRKGRYEILKIHTRGKPLSNDVDLEALSKATIGFSGADLANLANESALQAARKNHKRITARDFSDAFDRIVLGTEGPPLTNEEERTIVAYHEAGHAIAAALTPGSDPVLKVTIVPRGQALGITATLPEDDRRNYSRQYLINRMIMMLGGRAAEEIVFGEVTTGASNDLQRVTDLARRMVTQFGMSEKLGQVNFGDNESQPFLGYSLSQGRNYSDQTAFMVDQEVRQIIDEVYQRTVNLMRENKDKLDALAQALLENEVVDQETIRELTGVDFASDNSRVILNPEGSEPTDVVEPDAENQNNHHTPDNNE